MMDSLFVLIEQHDTPNLIIDLRYNGGGSSDMLEHILRYVASKSYGTASKYDTKISQQLVERYKEFEPFKELVGLVITHPLERTAPQDIPNRFHGRLFVLTSPFTFSTAAWFAAIVKDFELGTIIGEETGGLRESFGNVVSFSTPNYNVSFQVSNRKFYAPKPRIGDEEHGTAPDVAIDQEALSEYEDQDDPVLSFALDFIERESSVDE